MSANTRAPSTIVTIRLTGQTEFTIPFEYLARKYVEVTLLGIDRLPLVLNTDFRFVTKTLISLTSPYTSEYTQIELRRVTSATERLVDFHDGSILRAYDLNLSQIQTLHVAEEARDLTADTIGVNDEGHLDARNRRIVNLADAVNERDALTLGQVTRWDQRGEQFAQAAELSAESALQYMGGAKIAAKEARDAADEAKAVVPDLTITNSKVWSRRVVVAAVGSRYYTYTERGRELTPRLEFGGNHYLPNFEMTEEFNLTADPVVSADGTLLVSTDKGQRTFISAEAITRAESQVLFKPTGQHSSVANMVAGRSNGCTSETTHIVGSVYSTGKTLWKCKTENVTTILDFEAVGEVWVTDFIPANANSDLRPYIQEALDAQANTVICPSGASIVSDTLYVRADHTRLIIPDGSSIILDSTDVGASAVVVQGAYSEVTGGGDITSSNRHTFLVKLEGRDSMCTNVRIYNPVHPNTWPLDEEGIVYNAGGISMVGVRTVVSKCEVFNNIGSGIVSYDYGQVIQDNFIHHNGGLGIHVNHAKGFVSINGNNLILNDSVGILGNWDNLSVSITGNEVSSSGSHGIYARLGGSVISDNYCHNNRRSGIKVRDCRNSVVSNNSCRYNNTEQLKDASELLVQINEQGVQGLSIVGNVCMSTDSALSRSFGYNWVGPSGIVTNVTVSGNTFERAQFCYSNGSSFTGNTLSGELVVGVNVSSAPQDQVNGVVSSNAMRSLSVTNRVNDSVFKDNVMDFMSTPVDGPTKANSVIGNVFNAQHIQLQRRFFKVLAGNTVKISGVLSGPVTAQANNAADNSFKVLKDNIITNATTSLISDGSTTVSGNRNIITNNMIDTPSASMVSIWGSGHVITGNVNTSTGGTAYVGCNDSWLVGNSPKATERAGTTGNTIV